MHRQVEMTHTLIPIKILAMAAVILLAGCKSEPAYAPPHLHKLSQDEALSRFQNRQMPNPETVVFRSQDGREIPPDSLKRLNPMDYAQDFYQDENGEIREIVFRPANGQERAFNAELQKAFEEGPEVKRVEIHCGDKASILQRVFDRDQAMRRDDGWSDPNGDHENLEIVLSFLEQCGMPTLEEVDEVQMAGIWAVLQHGPAKYQRKYIPLLEESARRGDIKWSVIALMKDRALMYEGKPQVYGSQVVRGGLYDLHEPEYVNQRREEMGMEPIEDYLERFDIEFDVPQKKN